MKKAKFSLQFYIPIIFRLIPFFVKRELMWKDKYNTPRCEREPYFRFEWLWLGIYGVWGDDEYWEQWLWVHEYCDGNEEKAKETWEWIDYHTRESTWKDYT